MIRVANCHFASVIEQGDHLTVVSELAMVVGMFQEHLFIAEETRRNSVMSMLQVLRFLMGGQEAPAKQTGRELPSSLVVIF